MRPIRGSHRSHEAFNELKLNDKYFMSLLLPMAEARLRFFVRYTNLAGLHAFLDRAKTDLNRLDITSPKMPQ